MEDKRLAFSSRAVCGSKRARDVQTVRVLDWRCMVGGVREGVVKGVKEKRYAVEMLFIV